MSPEYEYQESQSNLRPMIKNQEFRQPKQRHPESIGACWKKINDRGIEYLSLKLESDKINLESEFVNIKCFLNSEKVEGDQKPHLICYLSKGINKERNGNK